MGEQIRVLGQLLKALCAIQNVSWTQKRRRWSDNAEIDDDTYDTYSQLIGRWSPLTEQDTESYFPVNSKSVEFNLSARRKALYLPPTSNQPHFIPVLTLHCSMNRTKDDTKIRIMLIQKRKDVLESIGFRFEYGEKVHRYYHAQLIKELHGINRSLNSGISYLEWLPESEPAIPVKANDSVTLMLCMLISLYGLENCMRLMKEHQVSELKTYIDHFR